MLTGGSGFLGSHIAEELDRQEIHTRVLVRPTSDVRFLETLNNVTLVPGGWIPITWMKKRSHLGSKPPVMRRMTT